MTPEALLKNLEIRATAHAFAKENWDWNKIKKALQSGSHMKAVLAMEETGGVPDFVAFEKNSCWVVDCSPQTPERKSLCYDDAALQARKANKPSGSAMQWCSDNGLVMVDEQQYHILQSFAPLDTKTSSWILTPKVIREKGGAIFGDHRFGRTFIYHNGAESYYAGRGFRAALQLF